jgi:hypothetical protein
MSGFRFGSPAQDLDRFQIKENLAKMRFYIEFEQEPTGARPSVN